MKRIVILLFICMLLLASCACAERSVAVPEGYVQGAALPIYRAVYRSADEAAFFERTDAAWFNESGVASYENTSRSGRYDQFIFNDEAHLDIGIGYIHYDEYDGVHYAVDGEDPAHPRGPFPRPSFATEIGRLAGNARLHMLWDEAAPHVVMEKTELAGLTLAQAQETVEELLAKLGLSGYELSFALDMDVEKIRLLGAWEEKRREEYYNGYDRYWDFTSATEADEGYYLFYERKFSGARADELDGDISLDAYVDGSGLVSFQLRDPYAAGDAYEIPERLLTAEEIFLCFEEGNPRREKDGFLQPDATGAELMYAPMRAPHKKDGMVFSPVWYVTYTFMDSAPCDGWAWYSAVDGRLIADCYS